MQNRLLSQQKPLEVVCIAPPPTAQRTQRHATFAAKGERRSRYSLPESLESASPVGYRTRVSLHKEEAEAALALLALERPTRFVGMGEVTEQELFEESALGVLSARQSTNFRGHRQVTLGPKESAQLAGLLRLLQPLDAPVLDQASYTHVVFSRPYRTAFTMLLTILGHKPLLNLLTIPLRALRKKLFHVDDIPSIGYLQQLHVGVLADAMERATVIASEGQRKAQIIMAPFCEATQSQTQINVLRQINTLCGLSLQDRAQGWRIALVAQVGNVPTEEQIALPRPLCRKIGANLLSFRSERIQPGVNQEPKAPAAYQERQDMDVSDDFTVMAGRAAYNAFGHWTGVDRERSKSLLLLERIDVLTPGGKERIREVRKMLEEVTEHAMRDIPLWLDLPTGRALSRAVARGKKAFALAGQRIYLGGLSPQEIAKEGIAWNRALRAVGAASARSALYCEIMGVTEIPEDCDMLAGVCMMAGPVNQNDTGKQFYGHTDLLAKVYPDQDPSTVLVWTLKAKTIADPIGNEEQLLNAKQKGDLVDLRPGPHDVIALLKGGKLHPMRQRDGKINQERGFSDVQNFVVAPDGKEISGNKGAAWPEEWAKEIVWLR
jgi:hypothetical protein